MINTWHCRNYNSIWYQLLFVFRHPIAFIRTFKEEMYAWPSLPNTIRKHWMKIYTRLPFQKACRWLGHELIYRVYDNKILDTFECRTRGKITKYYFANCAFGKVKFYEKTYTRNGKTCNIFMDCFVTTLVDQEQGKKNAEETKTEVRMLYKGWVFTKKKAFRILKEVINNNKEIYAGKGKDSYKYPTANEPWLVEKADVMFDILKKGKSLKSDTIYDTICQQFWDKYDDNVYKLYAYVSNLLHCINDWGAHRELAEILASCDNYIFHQEFLKNPIVDWNYKNMVEDGKTEDQLKTYYDIQIKLHNDLDKSVKKELKKRIQTVKDKWLNIPYDYYRC